MRMLGLGLFFIFASANAADPSLNSSFTAEAGLFYTNLGKAANDPTGSKSFLPTNQLMLSASSRMASLRPEIGFTFFPRHGANSSYDARSLLISVPFVFETTVDWKVGLAYWMYMLTAGGGNVILANGNSTATYSRPGRNETVKSVLIELGATVPIAGRFVLDSDIYIANVLSGKRSFNLLIQLGFAVL